MRKFPLFASCLWSSRQVEVVYFFLTLLVPATEVIASIFQAETPLAYQSQQFLTGSSGVIRSEAAAVSTRTPAFNKVMTEPCTDSSCSPSMCLTYCKLFILLKSLIPKYNKMMKCPLFKKSWHILPIWLMALKASKEKRCFHFKTGNRPG